MSGIRSRHVHEILRVPGYLSAQRFRVTRHPIGEKVVQR